jgi:hypothetical protein
MKKENLIAQLEGAKALSSQVDIDKVIELLNQLEPEIEILKVFGITQDVADNIADKIERTLDYNSDRFVDVDSAEFELDYNNQIRLIEVGVYVGNIMDHVTATLDSFVLEEDAEETEEDVVELERESDTTLTE